MGLIGVLSFQVKISMSMVLTFYEQSSVESFKIIEVIPPSLSSPSFAGWLMSVST